MRTPASSGAPSVSLAAFRSETALLETMSIMRTSLIESCYVDAAWRGCATVGVCAQPRHGKASASEGICEADMTYAKIETAEQIGCDYEKAFHQIAVNVNNAVNQSSSIAKRTRPATRKSVPRPTVAAKGQSVIDGGWLRIIKS